VLPRELGPGRAVEIAAVSVADASEALTRIGMALEDWITTRSLADGALVGRVAAAALYGKDPELPLGDFPIGGPAGDPIAQKVDPS
jgi:hypothetical protein